MKQINKLYPKAGAPLQVGVRTRLGTCRYIMQVGADFWAGFEFAGKIKRMVFHHGDVKNWE